MKAFLRASLVRAYGSGGAFFLGIFFVLLLPAATAVPPLSRYAPGETLEPNCAPGDANCSVIPPAASGANSDITSLSALSTALSVTQGGTGASTLTDGGILLGSGVGPFTPLPVLADGTIVIGDGATDPVTLAAFSSSSGQLLHERGGLEVDVSGYNGILRIAGGATSNVTDLAGLNTALSSTIPSADTNSSTLCNGTTTYLDGDGTCDDISGVYASFAHAHSAADITSGTLLHERGGLEANVSAFDGFIRISGGTTSEVKSAFAQGTAPTVNDDTGDGYVVGSRWIDTTADREYIALDVAAGAAVWKETTLTADGNSLDAADGSPTNVIAIDNVGHVKTSGTTPAVSSCGTGPTISGNDIAGLVTLGTGALLASCTLTFSSAYTTAPSCMVTGTSAAATQLSAVTTTTTLVISSASAIPSTGIMYICLEY